MGRYEGQLVLQVDSMQVRDKRDVIVTKKYLFFERESGRLVANLIWTHTRFDTKITDDSMYTFSLDSTGKLKRHAFGTEGGNVIDGTDAYLQLFLTKNKGSFSAKNWFKPEIRTKGDTVIFFQEYPDEVKRNIFSDVNGNIFRVRETYLDSTAPLVWESNSFTVVPAANWMDFLMSESMGRYKKFTTSASATPDVKPVITENQFPLYQSNGWGTINSTNKYLLLDFWYLSCPHCRPVTKILESQLDFIDSNKLLVMGVNPYDDSTDITNYVRNKRTRIPQTIEAFRFKKYNVQAYPTLLLLDKNGVIVKTFEGNYKGLDRDLLFYLRENRLLLDVN